MNSNSCYKQPRSVVVATVVAHQDHQGPDFVLCDKSHDAARIFSYRSTSGAWQIGQLNISRLCPCWRVTAEHSHPSHMIMWQPRLEWKALYHVQFSAWPYLLPKVMWTRAQSQKSLCRAIRKPAGHTYCQGACLLHIWKHWVQSIYKQMTGWSVKIRPAAAPPFILDSFNSVFSHLSFYSSESLFPLKCDPSPACLCRFVCLCLFFFFNSGFWCATGQRGLLEDHHCRCSCWL